MTDRYEYTAFGELLEHAGTDPQPYQFPGEPFNPDSGLYYNRARWLDSADGRFASGDPLDRTRPEPLLFHPYSYAAANPTNLIDPLGLFEIGTAVLGVSIAVSNIIGLISSGAVTSKLSSTGIFVQSHSVVAGVMYVGDAYHLLLRFVPTNQRKWQTSDPKLFKTHGRSKRYLATLGAGPERDNPAFPGKLIGAYSYNSNSFISGILIAAGVVMPPALAAQHELHPGMNKPVPSVNFTATR